jgi:transcription antitermination factor NusG
MEQAEMMRWYVVHSHAQAEASALWHLTNQGFLCFLPRVPQFRSHARQTRLMRVPLFPRYLFVRLDLSETRWRAINRLGVWSVRWQTARTHCQCRRV